MNLLCVFVVLLSCVFIQAWYGTEEPKFLSDRFDYYYRLAQKRRELEREQQERRNKREVTGSYPVGNNGKLIGTLGDTAKGGLYGTGAYEHTFTNGDGGRLAGQAYSTRVLNPNRDSTYYGGKLDWSDSNMHASVDARQRLGGRARMDVEAGGRWEPFKNSEVTAGGFYSKREGRPSDYGGLVNFRYNGW
ncbi:gloverin-like [Cydia pomonella]|uniref:gloverin-like n=1 Tax=Cydia pomonella TaxID=82600 RepID=UPI002ADD3856|nr:gloverin-like [Cydia pomonella]